MCKSFGVPSFPLYPTTWLPVCRLSRVWIYYWKVLAERGLNLEILLFLCMPVSLYCFINVLRNKTLEVLEWHLHSVKQLFLSNFCQFNKNICVLFTHCHPKNQTFYFPGLQPRPMTSHFCSPEKKRKKSSWNCYGTAACCAISIKGREQLPPSKTNRFPQQRIIFVSLHCCFFHHRL